ncbi:hypothetical protein [Streptomyces sp. SID5614]|uniref:restriction endonuclease subunit S n=1 Tax=Streptomyces sp. SID5614 TaxID=2690306 RepID=UPI00136A3803|nr:hypothetical protein [Streptomyces sp. SID5614]MZG04208.1 hypothetical protein [Streptomyces sp. SID5614]
MTSETWPSVPMSDLVDAFRDRVLPSDLKDQSLTHYSIPAFDENGSPIVEPAAALASHKFLVEEDSVLVSMLNPRIPRVWLARGGPNTVCSTEFAVLRPKPSGVSLGFLYLLCSEGTFARMLDRRSAGTTGSRRRSKVADVMAYRFSLPPEPIRERIVRVLGSVDQQVAALNHEICSLRSVYAGSGSLLWGGQGEDEAAPRALGQVMSLDVERVEMLPDREYHLAGVLNAGKGLVDKDCFLGAQTEYKSMNLLRSGKIVMRKLTAWEGPITVVPDEFDGYVASNEFPTFSLSGEVCPNWFRHVCRTPRLWQEMKNRVTGTVQRRKRLNPDQLLTVSLPVPRRDLQEKAAQAMDAIDNTVTGLRAEVDTLRTYRARLLSALLNREIDVADVEGVA